MANGRRITTHEASIKTATVEIKTLTVNGKQMTLAVFRQLKPEWLIDRTLTLRGVPWGWVNYHRGVDCEDEDDECIGEHLHVVWQLGHELRRSVVRLEDYPPWPELWEGDAATKGVRLSPRAVALRDQYDALIDSLAALDQLFIAV